LPPTHPGTATRPRPSRPSRAAPDHRVGHRRQRKTSEALVCVKTVPSCKLIAMFNNNYEPSFAQLHSAVPARLRANYLTYFTQAAALHNVCINAMMTRFAFHSCCTTMRTYCCCCCRMHAAASLYMHMPALRCLVHTSPNNHIPASLNKNMSSVFFMLLRSTHEPHNLPALFRLLRLESLRGSVLVRQQAHSLLRSETSFLLRQLLPIDSLRVL
jgi:hypothetical protein